MKSDQSSKLVMVTGFLALSYLFELEVLRHIALGLGLIFIVSKKASAFILLLWEKLALILGWINTRIILTLVFYLILMPLALIFRIFNRDILSMNWKNNHSSFTTRDHLYEAADLENPW